MAIYIERTLAKFMNLSEKLATELNHFLKTITYENNGELDSSLNEEERQKSISLMRVNASGEVSAQALYRGQAFFTKTPDVRTVSYTHLTLPTKRIV